LVRQTRRAGPVAESEQAWASAAASDPTGFYSERAADVLAGRGTFEPTGLFTFPTDLGADRLEAEEWLRAHFPITATGDLNELSESLAGDPRHVRGTELLALGLYDEARAEFEDLRLDYADDANRRILMHGSWPGSLTWPSAQPECSTSPDWTTPTFRRPATNLIRPVRMGT
jgi:hypothetical protein